MAKEKPVKPLKRHPSLVSLSKDHHQGLLLCWKIRTGIQKNIDPQRIAEYTSYFFDGHLRRHFREEEEILLARLSTNDELRRETEAQHNELYQIRNGLGAENSSYEKLNLFQQKLDAHIRFEERQLFPYLQEEFSEEELQEVAQLLSGEEPVDNWKDEFWNAGKEK